MSASRLTRTELAIFLEPHPSTTQRVVRALRARIFRAAPSASEAIKFHVLSYFREDSYLKSIGGNICMIEIKRGSVVLSFIRGAGLPDPTGILYGTGKFKRFVDIPDVQAAKSVAVAELLRAAALAETMHPTRTRRDATRLRLR